MARMEDRKKDFFCKLLHGAIDQSLIPDIGIESDLVGIGELNSAAEPNESTEDTLHDVLLKVPRVISAISPFTGIPEVLGLGAEVLSIALELLSKKKEKSEDMFAKEKVRLVRDSMEEYVRRLNMYSEQPSRALEETERLEKQLSEQLTRLKNSMLHDNQMSSRSLKHWTNGAAFHLQMLIHAERLKIQINAEHEVQLQVHESGTEQEEQFYDCLTKPQFNSINNVLNCYEYDLERLLEQYKTYKKSTISLTFTIYNLQWVYEDKEIGRKSLPKISGRWLVLERFKPLSNEYVDYMFKNWTEPKLKSYFSILKNNIVNPILINQVNRFSMQNE